ncbi:GATA transcription factor 23 [Triticum urartu]|uniref:GATA transcription factor 23 n=1 Tax=Triticum urartu TaxID=4572 RepID=M7ZGJ0_TRIUA|nr:GATA transcription factor 23 [Triticum urartu]
MARNLMDFSASEFVGTFNYVVATMVIGVAPAAGEGGRMCCVECRTTTTPMWRSGPTGPRTLCNACGIRYRKKRRQELGLDNKPQNQQLNQQQHQQQQQQQQQQQREDHGEATSAVKDSSSSSNNKSSNLQVVKKKRTVSMGVEEAAFLLMALSSSSTPPLLHG